MSDPPVCAALLVPSFPLLGSGARAEISPITIDRDNPQVYDGRRYCRDNCQLKSGIGRYHCIFTCLGIHGAANLSTVSAWLVSLVGRIPVGLAPGRVFRCVWCVSPAVSAAAAVTPAAVRRTWTP